MNTVIEQPQAAIQQRHPETETLTNALVSAARDPGVNIEKMERLMAMHERIMARDAEQQFNAAMVSAQSKMGRVSADAVNPQTRSAYASYAQLDRHLRPIYTSLGLSLSFNSGADAPEGRVKVLCYVSHLAGHTRTYQCDMPADGKGAKGNDVMTKTHAAGAAMSYGMRYLLKLIFNVAIGMDDDDGNLGSADTSLADEWIGYANAALTPEVLADTWKRGLAAIRPTGDMQAYEAFKAAVHAKGEALKGAAQ